MSDTFSDQEIVAAFAAKKKYDELNDALDAEGMFELLQSAEFNASIKLDAISECREHFDGEPIETAFLHLAHANVVFRRMLELHSTQRRAIAARVAALEARPAALSYEGVWRCGQEAKANQCFTFGGSVWHCRTDTYSKPGESAAWQLAVKGTR